MAEPFVQYFFKSDFDPRDPTIKFIVCLFLSPLSESEFYKFKICFGTKVFSGNRLYYSVRIYVIINCYIALTYCFNNKN